MSEATVLAAMEAAIETISGLRASSYMVEQPNPPMACIVPAPFDPRMVFSEAKAERLYEVILFAARAPAEASQKLLRGYCDLSGSTSVLAALQGASSLNDGSTADYVSVVEIGGLEITATGGTEYLTRKLTCEVVF